MILLKIFGMGILTLIAFQDFTKKAILWILFPTGFIVFLVSGLLEMQAVEYLKNVLLNFLFVLTLLALLVLYFSIKRKKPTNIIDSYFGLGDLLFLGILSTVFSTVNFILFLTGSFLFILLIYTIFNAVRSNKKIPLAGLLAIILVGVMLTDILTGRINLLSNQSGYLLLELF